jgi:hypothetical protein
MKIKTWIMFCFVAFTVTERKSAVIEEIKHLHKISVQDNRKNQVVV